MADLEAIIIRGTGLIGPLGADSATVTAAYAHGVPHFATRAFTGPNGRGAPMPVAGLPAAAEALLRTLAAEPALRGLDRAALLAVSAARQARAEAGWDASPPSPPQTLLTGIGIGSSRGATGKLEDGLAQFQQTGRVAPSTSPLTTPGNLASAVAQDFLGADGGPLISHSSTCSSALQALGTGLAWLRAGLADRYLAGGTEAPLTAFTVAQLRAVGIYSDLAANDFPCRPGWVLPDGVPAPNTFVLGEGAAVFALERARPLSGDVLLTAVGFGLERAPSRTGITPTGQHFQQAMHRALMLARLTPTDVDAIVLHAPGTTAGDAAELAAIAAIFGPARPALLTGKHLTGHTLGASAALSLHYALWLLRAAPEVLPPLPYPNRLGLSGSGGAARHLRRRVLVNAAGFGGNAACALVELMW